MNIGRKRRRSGGEESSLLDLFQAGDQYYGFAGNWIGFEFFAKGYVLRANTQHRVSGWILRTMGGSKGLFRFLRLSFHRFYQ